MKKTIFLAIVALMALACSEPISEITLDEPQAASGQLQPMTFKAIFDEGPATKTYIDNNVVKWRAGDAISVFDMIDEDHITSDMHIIPSTNTRFDLTDGANTTSGTFTAASVAKSKSGYLALYPYDSKTVLSMTTIVNAKLPDSQSLPTADVCNDPSAAMMVGFTDPESNTMPFKNVCAFVKLHIDVENATEICLIANDGEPLAGSFKLTLLSDEYNPDDFMSSINEVDGPYVVTLKPYGDAFVADKDYYIAVLPQTLSAGICPCNDMLSGNLDIQYCIIKSGVQIAEGSSTTTYPGCSVQDHISCSDMDALRKAQGYSTYAEWQGSDGTLDLVLGF